MSTAIPSFDNSLFPTSTQPKFRNVLMTPKAAAEALATVEYIGPNERRSTVRSLSPNRVAKYCKDMRAGHWRVTGDPIRFDSSGRLIDGQHRLKAVIDAGVPVEMTVAWNVPDAAVGAIDIGSARTAGQILGAEGIDLANQAAAVARWDFWYESQRRGNSKHHSGQQPTVDEIRQYLVQHQDLIPSIRIGHKFNGKRVPIIAPAAAAFVHYKASRMSPQKADQFIGQLLGDVPITGRYAPANVLKEYCLAEQLRGQLNRWASMWMAIACWLLHEGGRSARGLHYGPDKPVGVFTCDQ